MRFPPDVGDAVAVIRRAIDSGLVYIDTSRGYGDSELILAKALKNGYREKVFLSTKCSPWIRKIDADDDGSADSVRKRIDEALARLDVSYLDFYQVWNINSPEAWETATRKGGMVDGIKKAMSEGLVRHTGFTTHEEPERLPGYLEAADWAEVVLISYNPLQRSYAGVLEKAKSLGIGTIVMNPCGGGRFAENSAQLMSLAREVGADSVAELSIRYVHSNPHVDTMLCGASKISDVDSAVSFVEKGRFSAEQMAVIERFLSEKSPEAMKFCTDCEYCLPCPAGINIPAIMGLIHNDRAFGLRQGSEKDYNTSWITGKTADACLKCGKCEEKCTQKLPVMKDLQWAHSRYSKKT
jgi:predicted aldo/keto reductase-like oxidoreductase